jgi:hypothetical protein
MEEGFIRPKPSILPEDALVPAQNVIAPPPNQFTHVVTQRQPFYFTHAAQSVAPDGEFASGAKVVLLVFEGGDFCRVADEEGLYVETAYAGLRRL